MFTDLAKSSQAEGGDGHLGHWTHHRIYLWVAPSIFSPNVGAHYKSPLSFLRAVKQSVSDGMSSLFLASAPTQLWACCWLQNWWWGNWTADYYGNPCSSALQCCACPSSTFLRRAIGNSFCKRNCFFIQKAPRNSVSQRYERLLTAPLFYIAVIITISPIINKNFSLVLDRLRFLPSLLVLIYSLKCSRYCLLISVGVTS